MKTIYKYTVDLSHLTGLALPPSAKVLRFGTQEGDMFIWVELDTQEPTEERFFQIIGTGHPLPELEGRIAEYVGTADQGPFVWHLYELVEGVKHLMSNILGR